MWTRPCSPLQVTCSLLSGQMSVPAVVYLCLCCNRFVLLVLLRLRSPASRREGIDGGEGRRVCGVSVCCGLLVLSCLCASRDRRCFRR